MFRKDETQKTKVIAYGDPLHLEDFPDTPVVKPMSSTPVARNEDTTQQLRELIGELGSQIGDSIVSRLLASQTPLTPQQSHSPEPVRVEALSSTIDLTKVNLVVKADVKEPPMFRGDGTDKYSVQEWIDMMEVYLHKKDCSNVQQIDEILGHLWAELKALSK